MESSGLTLDSCFSRIAGVTALREGFERFEREGAPIFDLLDPEGFGTAELEHALGARHAEAEHRDGARLGVAEWFEVNPAEGRGRKADPVAQEHR
jgi:hypothetical protein